jgi:hypothetical protein
MDALYPPRFSIHNALNFRLLSRASGIVCHVHCRKSTFGFLNKIIAIAEIDLIIVHRSRTPDISSPFV